MLTKPQHSGIPHFYTVPEIAKHLKVSERQVRRWIAKNELVVHRLGRSVRVAKSDLDAFLARQKGS